MRKLVWFTLGFGAVCALGTYLSLGLWMLLIGAGGAMLFGMMQLAGRRYSAGMVSAFVFLGITVGSCWFCAYDGIYLQPARIADGTTQKILLRVKDAPVETDYGIYVDGSVVLDGRNFGCRLYLTDPTTVPDLDDRVSVAAKLQLTTGGGEEPTYHRSNGIFLLAYAADECEVIAGTPSLKSVPVRFRLAVTDLLRDIFPEDTIGFSLALLLGDKSGLSYQQRNEMSIAGVSHVVAVSGLHLSIAFAIVRLLTFRRRILSAVIGIPAAFFFAAMTGFTPSVLRAAVMLSLSLLARVVDRDYDGATALAFGALVLLVYNPIVSASISFQLSVGAVAGIFCFAKPLEQWMCRKLSGGRTRARLAGRIAASAASTLSATVFTLPLTAINFGVISLIAPAANLLILWAIDWIFYGTVLAGVVGAVWLAGGKAVAWCISWLIRYVLEMVAALSKLPFAAIYPEMNPYAMAWVCFVLVLLVLFLLGHCGRKRVALLCGSLTLMAAILLPFLQPLGERFRVTVLDVGQGQCVVLQSGGRTFVVDCGGSDDEKAGETAARYLLTQGISHIDGLILTHYDSDHISGVQQLFSRIDVEAMYLPYVPDTPACHEISALGDRRLYVTADLCLTWAEAELRIFAPVSSGSSNENGLSVLFTVLKYDTLITGDMNESGELRLLKSQNLPDIELLIAGHHGSKHSTGKLLLEATAPEVIAISVGSNSYGHPAQQMLDRAAAIGSRVYRTDQDGTLIFRG